MITASEALDLPNAKLSDSDAKATREILTELEEQVRHHMTRTGCTVQLDPKRLNGPIAFEVERAFRSSGWQVQIQLIRSASALAPNQQVITGCQIVLVPTDDSYRAHAKAHAD